MRTGIKKGRNYSKQRGRGKAGKERTLLHRDVYGDISRTTRNKNVREMKKKLRYHHENFYLKMFMLSKIT